MIQGRSINSGSLARVDDVVRGYECPLVSLDSNHTHDMYLLSSRPCDADKFAQLFHGVRRAY